MPSSLCEHCTAVCCRYIALPLDKPTSAEDFDDIRWYLAHENVTVFVDKGQWYISFATPCRYLGQDLRCGIYQKRPRICRGYRTGNCDYHGGEYRYDLFFCEPGQIERYAAERFGRKKRNRSAKRKE
jgi:Fe-S-cluster containining protein